MTYEEMVEKAWQDYKAIEALGDAAKTKTAYSVYLATVYEIKKTYVYF